MAQFAVCKIHSDVHTPVNVIERYRFEINDGSCYDSDNCHIGKMATVTAGRKIPKGTRVTIKRTMESKYGQTFKSAWSHKIYNLVVLVELPDGTTTWTQGQNLTLDLEETMGYVATIEAENENEAKEKLEKDERFKNVTGSVFYIDRDGKPKNQHFGLLDAGLSFYNEYGKKYLTDCGDVWACVLDDWRSDTYSFRVFTKVPALNNTIELVDVGQPKHWDDMGGDTGIGAAIEAYEAYVKEHAVA